MLLKRLKLVNYGGIYNGLGLNEIEIDFTRCQHRIILIKGDNGSGKSTIEGALKPLPDDNTSFIAGKDAMKEIEYFDEVQNIVYSIRFVHEYKGSSRTTKGYISKGLSGSTMVELNPSGNITSCKDVIYEELQLDPNYIALTQLSSTKRGIADLKPADRKRYVNAILSATDVYNDMYKVLGKKASNLKALVQSVAAKIDNIGNVVQLEQSMKSLDERISEFESAIERQTEIMNKEKGMLQSIDPDNKIQERIDRLKSSLEEYQAKRNEVDKELRKIYTKYPDIVTMNITQELVTELKSKLIELSNQASSINSKISMLMESRKADSAELQAKTAKLKSINSAGSLSDIKKIKRELNDKKAIIESRWGNIINLNNITVDEFISIYEVIKEMINVISTTNVITSNLDTEYRNCLAEIEDIENNIELLINHNNKIASAEDKVFILEKRPVTCKDDTCPFISDALKAKSLLDDMLAIRKYSKSISQLNRDKDALQDRLNDIDNSKYLYKLYTANQRVLRFLNFGFDTFEDCIYHLKTNSNNILVTLRGVIDYANDIEEYKKINQTLTDIENKYHALSSQEDFINMIVSDISRLQNQLNEDTNTITELNNALDSINSDFKRISLTVDLYDSYLEKTATLNNLDESIRILKEEIETNRNNIDRLQKINEDLEKLEVNIAKLKEELKPLREERESLNYKIKNSIEYTKELNKYQSMYEKIDTLKYYCSPTTGIQLLFANMYLNKILANANRILSGLFGGIFALLPLVVTESEFRIPVAVNGGINHDDITSMSSAQVSLISMIISIALLSQTSTKLNIIVGDEIDAPFDSENRREFITILYQLMSLVKASQCVLISHNSEIPMNECDIILLKSDNDIITSGNIIWSYR